MSGSHSGPAHPSPPAPPTLRATWASRSLQVMRASQGNWLTNSSPRGRALNGGMSTHVHVDEFQLPATRTHTYIHGYTCTHAEMQQISLEVLHMPTQPENVSVCFRVHNLKGTVCKVLLDYLQFREHLNWSLSADGRWAAGGGGGVRPLLTQTHLRGRGGDG